MNRTILKRLLLLNLVLIVAVLSQSCKNENKVLEDLPVEDIFSDEVLYRSNFHFTPLQNWMNDPNGMFYKDGLYHLYFQYYPNDNVWGPMHWGHATSKDMIAWEEQKIAIYPDSLGYIFSGSAVVDKENSSGLGQENNPATVAIFTYHDPVGEKEKRIDFQSQAIAYSLDNGMTFTKFEGNPVLPNPGIKDFRDPKVIWDEDREQWVMALATYESTHLYSSPNLKSWKFLSKFGEGIGAHGGVWECPDFFPMKVEGSDEKKWVLLQSLGQGGPNGGSGTQYFIGDFDGTSFTLDPNFEKQLEDNEAIWLDYGRDNYAGVTWSNIPESDGRKLFIGWMSNWDYALKVPTTTWRSAMTVARSLELHSKEEGYYLTSYPVEELNNYVSEKNKMSELIVNTEVELDRSDMKDWGSSKLDLIISDPNENHLEFVLENEENERLILGLDYVNNNMYLDRMESGDLTFSEKFALNPSRAPLPSADGEKMLTLLIDKTSIEVFYDKGALVMTEIIFPSKPFTDLTIKSLNGSSTIKDLAISEIKVHE